MRIQRIEIENFRSFGSLDLRLDGESIFLISENGGGKSSLLTAIARAMGRDLAFSRSDFGDPAAPIVLRVTLTDLDTRARAVFASYADFGAGPPTLRVEARAVWDSTTDEADVDHGYPRQPNSRSRKEERDALPVQWLPASRDPARMLQLGINNNLMGRILETLPLQGSLAAATADIQAASARLAGDPALAQLFQDSRNQLADLVPDVLADPFSLDIAAVTPHDLLRQFDLLVEHHGEPISVTRQSSGIAQLAIFVFAILLARRDPGRILLVDEPEVSLHPQSQRALMGAISGLDAQVVVATHSASLLNRADPRSVARLKRETTGVSIARPSSLTPHDARRLSRYTTPQAAEAFFARRVVLVEGVSDMLVVEGLAQRRGQNLSGAGVAVVPVGGAGVFDVHHQLYGPRGLQLNLAGLCDRAEERYVQAALEADGAGRNLDQATRERLGFFVCDSDLEDELLDSIGDPAVTQLIAANGHANDLALYAGQPPNRARTQHENLLGFLRRRKVEYAPLLTDAVDMTRIPRPLEGLLDHVG